MDQQNSRFKREFFVLCVYFDSFNLLTEHYSLRFSPEYPTGKAQYGNRVHRQFQNLV